MAVTVLSNSAENAPTIYNLTRSIKMLEESCGWEEEFSSPHQPYCSGVGLRTSFMDDPAAPFAPFSRTCHSGSYTDLVRLDDELYLRVIEDTRKKTCKILAPGEDWLKFSFMVNGGVSQAFGQTESITFSGGYAEVYLHPPGMSKLEGVEDACWGTSVTLYYSREQFLSLAQSYIDELPESLQGYLMRNVQALILETLPMTNTLLRTVVDIVNTPYLGALRHSYVRAKATELMCEVVHLLSHQQEWEANAIKLSARDKRQLEMARQVLINNYVDAPTITQLARHVGVNQRKLKMGFKQLFGTTIFDFAQGMRLDKAWQLLISGDYAIGQVAEMVGYNYAKNFTTAFKKHFGVSPKVARSGRIDRKVN
jgi:AraC-like DNA-binding protein